MVKIVAIILPNMVSLVFIAHDSIANNPTLKDFPLPCDLNQTC
jgi:hypothetical protein